MPRFQYTYKEAPVVSNNISDILATLVDIGKWLPSSCDSFVEGIQPDITAMNISYSKAASSKLKKDGYTCVVPDELKPELEQQMNNIYKAIDGMLGILDKEQYPLQVQKLNILKTHIDYYLEGINYPAFINPSSGPGYLANPAMLPIGMDIAVGDWPDEKQEKDEFLKKANDDFKNTPFITSAEKGVTAMQNLSLIHI